MSTYGKLAGAMVAVIVMGTGNEILARGRGGAAAARPAPSVSRPAASAARPAAPAAGQRPAAGQLPAAGQRPAAGQLPAAGQRPAAGQLPAAGSRPGAVQPGTRPSTTDLRQHLNLPAAGTGPAATAASGARTAAAGAAARTPAQAQQARAAMSQRMAAHPLAHPYTAGWYARHPGLFMVQHPWAVATWVGLAAWCGVTAAPVSYGYGGYGESVSYPAEPAANDAAAAAYEKEVDQANQLAAAGQQSQAALDQGDWMSVGVFALVPGGQTQANSTVQLNVSKDGIVKGTYYDMLTDSVQPLSGSINLQTQMVAWALDSNKSIVYETGLQTLTENEGPVMVHLPGNQSQKWLMVRMQEPAPAAAAPPATPK